MRFSKVSFGSLNGLVRLLGGLNLKKLRPASPLFSLVKVDIIIMGSADGSRSGEA